MGIFRLFFSICIISSVAPWLAAQSLSAERFSDIKAQLKAFGDDVSLSVIDEKGNLIFNQQGLRKRNPASIAKLVSTACALDTLGPAYRFETPWSHTGSITNGVLNGDLVVEAKGDFSFVIEDLKMIVERILFIHGIKEIKGSLVVDSSYFKSPRVSPYEGFENDSGRAFTTDLSALPINHNAFAVWVSPSQGEARITISPHQAVELKVTNTIKVGKGRLNGSQLRLDYRKEQERLILGGRIGASDEPKAFYRAIPDPYTSFARLFAHHYRSLGGKWKGDVKIQASAVRSNFLFHHRSHRLNRVMSDINKLSTNFGAEMLLLAAASKSNRGQPVGMAESQKQIRECLNTWGAAQEGFDLKNASGLSRASQVRAQDFAQLLYRFKSKQYWPEYATSLSLLGEDGTTRKRLSGLEGRARLKTGRLRNVRSLAGYIRKKEGAYWSFALILNCQSCPMSRWEQSEDAILKELIEM